MRRRSFLNLTAGAGVGLLAGAGRARAATPARTEVLIIGAGLAGLATGLALKKAGIAYHLLELGPRVGGRVRTINYRIDGQTVYADAGMEEYWQANPAVRLIEELRLPTRSDVALSSMIIDGVLQPLGTSDRDAFLQRILGGDGVRAWADLQGRVAPVVADTRGRHLSPATLALAQPSFAAWIEQQRLPRRLAEWIRISVEVESGTDWDQISALEGALELSIFLGPGEKSYRVLGGNQRFTDALARAVGPARVSLHHRATRIERRDGRLRVGYLDLAQGLGGTIDAAHVVCTVPAFRLSELQFDPPLSEGKRRAIATQGFGSYLKAHLFLPRRSWGAFEREGASLLPLLSDSELGVMYDGNPDQRTATRVLSLLVTGPRAETFTMQPLDEVRASIRGRLGALFPGVDREVHGIELHRYHPRAVAAWPPGRSRFDALSDELRRPEGGVHLAGDFTESSHSDGAFTSAARAVREITAG